MYINFCLVVYLANNLYGYAMCKYMPIGDFAWYTGNPEVALAQLEWMRETDDVGRVYEVDISYPQSLHDAHNDMPFLPHASIPNGSSVRKLMVTFLRKENYVVHYLNLKQAMAHGVIVEKVLIIIIIITYNIFIYISYRYIECWNFVNRHG